MTTTNSVNEEIVFVPPSVVTKGLAATISARAASSRFAGSASDNFWHRLPIPEGPSGKILRKNGFLPGPAEGLELDVDQLWSERATCWVHGLTKPLGKAELRKRLGVHTDEEVGFLLDCLGVPSYNVWIKFMALHRDNPLEIIALCETRTGKKTVPTIPIEEPLPSAKPIEYVDATETGFSAPPRYKPDSRGAARRGHGGNKGETATTDTGLAATTDALTGSEPATPPRAVEPIAEPPAPQDKAVIESTSVAALRAPAPPDLPTSPGVAPRAQQLIFEMPRAEESTPYEETPQSPKPTVVSSDHGHELTPEDASTPTAVAQAVPPLSTSDHRSVPTPGLPQSPERSLPDRSDMARLIRANEALLRTVQIIPRFYDQDQSDTEEALWIIATQLKFPNQAVVVQREYNQRFSRRIQDELKSIEIAKRAFELNVGGVFLWIFDHRAPHDLLQAVITLNYDLNGWPQKWSLKKVALAWTNGSISQLMQLIILCRLRKPSIEIRIPQPAPSLSRLYKQEARLLIRLLYYYRESLELVSECLETYSTRQTLECLRRLHLVRLEVWMKQLEIWTESGVEVTDRELGQALDLLFAATTSGWNKQEAIMRLHYRGSADFDSKCEAWKIRQPDSWKVPVGNSSEQTPQPTPSDTDIAAQAPPEVVEMESFEVVSEGPVMAPTPPEADAVNTTQLCTITDSELASVSGDTGKELTPPKPSPSSDGVDSDQA